MSATLAWNDPPGYDKHKALINDLDLLVSFPPMSNTHVWIHYRFHPRNLIDYYYHLHKIYLNKDSNQILFSLFWRKRIFGSASRTN